MFALNGALFGLWASRIPAFVDRHGIEPGALGLVLFAMAAGAILSFPIAGGLSDKMGAARATRRIALVYMVTLWLLPLAPNVWMLAAALALFGSAHGGMDVTMNAWAAEVESRAGRPVMSSLHAMWSLGAGLGAALGWGSVQIGLAPGPQFWGLGLALGAAAMWLAAIAWESTRHHGGPAFAFPRGILLLVGLVAFGSAIGEGAMADWSAVFLTRVAGATEAQAALGYAAYSAAMVAMRLAGDRVVLWFGPVRAVRTGGLLAAAGALVALTLATPATAILGFMVMGLGYAVVMPLAFGRAARDPNLSAGRAIASVATLGYGGVLIGPPVIGAVAAAFSLPAGFGLIALLALGIAALAGVLAPPQATVPVGRAEA
ncbi:MAG: MFS transporter [Rhodobacteraceae bacterium]|nr:MFS transporter [Paracoccaceae bacterium]